MLSPSWGLSTRNLTEAFGTILASSISLGGGMKLRTALLAIGGIGGGLALYNRRLGRGGGGPPDPPRGGGGAFTGGGGGAPGAGGGGGRAAPPGPGAVRGGGLFRVRHDIP